MDDIGDMVKRAQAGDLGAYGRLVGRFQDMAYGYAYSLLGDFHLAEDAAQEAFIAAYRDLGKLTEPAAFAGWFRRIVARRCGRLTRGKTVSVVSLDAAAGVAADEQGPAGKAEEREMKTTVLEAIKALPETERTATTLFYINGYSQKDIAEFLEVPVSTVKNRLHASRNRLKERMVSMVEETLKDHSLPENFADRLLMFPFPRREPEVEIVDLAGETMTVRCLDAQSFFVPLVEHGASDWCFYDWPGGRLTGVNEYRVIAQARYGERTILRIWHRHTDYRQDEKLEWEEIVVCLEDDTYRFVTLERAKDGGLRVGRYRWGSDPKGDEWDEPELMNLGVGTKWTNGDAASEVVGVGRVTVGKRSWKCLKVVALDWGGRSDHSRPVLAAEWYVAETGRTVFFRRYNGPGYAAAEEASSFESLEGNREVEWEGVVFRHFYDCIPDIALEKGFAT